VVTGGTLSDLLSHTVVKNKLKILVFIQKIMQLLVELRETFTTAFKGAISHFFVLPGNAETLVKRGGK